MATGFSFIASQVLSGSASTVTFSSIPQTYTDIVVRGIMRGTGTGTNSAWSCYIQFDSGTTFYTQTQALASGTALSTTTSSAIDSFFTQFFPGSTGTTNLFGTVEFYIPSYTKTSARQIATTHASESVTGGGANNFIGAGRYTGTSAISSITLFNDSGNSFAAGSAFYLYGIKNS